MPPKRYTDSGVYPVNQGQLWRVGNHWFTCGDLLDSENPWHELHPDYPPDLVYCDPPWTNGLARTFRTLSGLPQVGYDVHLIFEAIVKLAESVPLWLVTDRKPSAHILGLLDAAHHATWQLHGFTGGRDSSVLAVLHYVHDTPPPDADFTDLIDRELPGRILDQYDTPGIIADPCSGLGITSRAAYSHGWASINNELSPTRMSAALRKLEKASGQHPERIT
jgi:hypothetical protein